MARIYLLNDYLTSKTTLNQIQQTLNNKFQDYEIISLDFSDYYETNSIEDINLFSAKKYFSDYIKNNIEQSDILVAIGTSARFLLDFKNNTRIYINPLVYNNLVNVFCASNKYFENNLEQFEIYLSKMINLESVNLEHEYNWYSNYYSKILKLTENINLYEVLKSLKKEDQYLFLNSQVYLSSSDEILNAINSYNYLTKLKNKTKINFVICSTNSKEHLFITNEF